MSNSPPSSAGGDSQPPSPQHWDQHVDWHYRRYVDNHIAWPESSGGWQWPPYIRSLVEEELKFPQFTESLFGVRPRRSDPPSDGDSDEDHDAAGPPAGPTPPQNLPPGGDPRNYLLPTAYAMRWGIFPGRDDGRSRMSPPYSNTRVYNPAINEHFVNTIDESNQNLLLQETRLRMRAGTTTYRGSGIAPEVIDEARRNSGYPGQEDLAEHARNSASPFSRLVLPRDLVDLPLKGMVRDILGDEDYQRILFGDWTTDELIRHDVHTMSNTDQSSLIHEPLHELLTKQHWEQTTYKGIVKDWPRLFYELGGQCKEYDVHKNAELWDALQPALQVVSKVLRSKPPFWTALKDLRTRVAINRDYDPRPYEDRRTDRLVRIRLLDEALKDDAVRDWPVLYQIADDGLDYQSAVDYILGKSLRLEIVSGHMTNGRYGEAFRYGITAANTEDDPPVIRCSLSAEMMWPLLEPRFSSSEKLATSFLIAVVLLHELMHATQYAIDILCTEDASGWVPNLTPGMAFDLDRWRDATQDLDTAQGDPWFGWDVHAELGWAFENHFFGMVLYNLAGTHEFVGQHVAQLPVALAAQAYMSEASQTGFNNALKDFYYCRHDASQEPLPVYFYSKFFNQAFWDQMLPTFGFDAFRRRLPERTLLYSLQRSQFNPKALEIVCGEENQHFFTYVINTLNQFGYNLLAHWLKQTLMGAVAHVDIFERWLSDVLSWRYSRDAWQEAVDDMERVKASGDVLWRMARHPTQEKYYRWASGWNGAAPCPGYEDWVRIAQDGVGHHFSTGGPFFTTVAQLQGLADAAMGEMEFMVFEFLTMTSPERLRHYNSAAALPINPIPQLLARLDEFRGPLKESVTAMEALRSHVSGRYPELCELWSSRHQATLKMLDHLEWLVRAHNERSDEENHKLRENLRSVPSAHWEGPQKRLRDMGTREYQLVAPPIRAAIDEYDRRLRAIDEYWKSAEGRQQLDEILAQHYQYAEDRWHTLGEEERDLLYP